MNDKKGQKDHKASVSECTVRENISYNRKRNGS